MTRVLVWDLPTRLFHWLLAALLVTAFAIAQLVDDESTTFFLHMLAGGTAAFMVLLRVVWGLVGSRWARFGSFAFGPGAVIAYLRSAVGSRGNGPRHIGHNPGSAWGIFAMLALVLGLAFTGVNMATTEAFEEVHENLAWALVGFVALHLAGVLWHTVRHRENITASMIHGHKLAAPTDGIRHAHLPVALLFLALVATWGWALVRGFDATTRSVTLPLVGRTLQLGEAEDRPGAAAEPGNPNEASGDEHGESDED